MTLAAAFLKVFAGLAAATAAGWVVSRVWTSGLTRRERLAWSLAAGLLVQAAGLLLLLAAGTKPSAAKLLAVEAAVAGIAWLATRSLRPLPPPVPVPSGPRVVIVFLAVLAGAAFLVFLAGALADAMWATDYLAFWGYKGKIVFLTSEVPRRLFQDPALDFAHREYPLLVPLSLAALAEFLGEWNAQALALLYPVCALATLLAISGFLERRVSRLSGAAAAALSALCFFLYRPQNAGTAEVPFALGLVLAASAAVDFLQRDAASSVGRLAVASLFCATLKQEGSLFVLLLATVFWLRLRSSPARPRRFAVAALVLPVAAHWILLYALRGNQTRRDFDFTLFEPRRWAELPALFATVIGRMAGTEGRDAILPILAIAVFFLVTRRGIGDPLLPVFLVQLLFYAIAFTVSSFDPLYAIDGAFRRITMSLFPAFTLVMGARLPSAFSASSGAAARTRLRPAEGTARS